MRRYKLVVLVVLFAVFQIIFSLWENHLFFKHVLEIEGLIERQMAESGVPPDQRGHVISAMGSIGLQVSSYVRSVTLTSIIMNAVLLIMLFNGWRRESSSSQGEV